MKKLLFLVSLAGATWCLAPTTARAQTTTDTTRTAPPTAKPQLNTGPPGAPAPAPAPKPQLNTAPPGPPAQPARPQQGQYEVTRPAVPVAPPPPVNQPLPAPRPNQNSPSGLEFPAGSRASEQPKPLRRYFLYSNFGLGFSSIYGLTRFNISAAPALGYRVTDKFSIGPGISYSYSSLSFQGGGPGSSLRMNSLGVKGFAQYMVYGDFFLHGEYEVTRAEVPFQDQSGNIFVGKLTVKTPLAGAGYRQHFSDRIAADIVVLYNFNGNGLNDIYGQPVIRFSFLYELGR